MTVQELIDKLKTFEPDRDVLVNSEMFVYSYIYGVEEDGEDVCLVTQ